MKSSNFKIGEIVKYSNPKTDFEKTARFNVIGISPGFDKVKEKLTVQFISKIMLSPVSCFFSSEFVKA